MIAYIDPLIEHVRFRELRRVPLATIKENVLLIHESNGGLDCLEPICIVYLAVFGMLVLKGLWSEVKD